MVGSDGSARIYGQIGLFGVCLALVGSLVQANPEVGGDETWREGIRISAALPPFRTFVGGVLGTLGCAIALLGLVGVFRGLSPAGRPLAWISAGGFALWLVMYGAWQAVRPMLAHLQRVGDLALDAKLYTDALTYLNVHRSFGGLGLFTGSVFFFFTVLFRPTAYPRWAAAATPIVWLPLIRLTPVLPEGAAGPFLYAYLDAMLLPLMVLTAFSIAFRRADRTRHPPPSAGRTSGFR